MINGKRIGDFVDIKDFHKIYGPKLKKLGFYTDGTYIYDYKGNIHIEYKNFKKDSPFLYDLLVIREDKYKKKLVADLQHKFTNYWNLSLRKLFYMLEHGITAKDKKYTDYPWI